MNMEKEKFVNFLSRFNLEKGNKSWHGLKFLITLYRLYWIRLMSFPTSQHSAYLEAMDKYLLVILF